MRKNSKENSHLKKSNTMTFSMMMRVGLITIVSDAFIGLSFLLLYRLLLFLKKNYWFDWIIISWISFFQLIQQTKVQWNTMLLWKQLINEEPEQVIEFDSKRTIPINEFLTDANIYLSIFGEKNKIERYHLDQASDPSHNFFESGSTDRFHIYNVDVGKVSKILSIN